MSFRDPIGVSKRRRIARRRLGQRKGCKCGENRPEALITTERTLICIECRRLERGSSTQDDHHSPGRANCNKTIPVPANDHRAILSPAQYEWPKRTLRNPERSPLLSIAVKTRGTGDHLRYLSRDVLPGSPEFLELLDQILTQRFGRRWWKQLGFDSKRRRNEKHS